MVSVKDLTDYLNERFPEKSAEPWDAVGLTVGRDEAPVASILCAVDIDPIVVAEAIELGVDMIITHHPLFLSGTITVATRTPKGAMVHDLILNDIALYTAHTNADIAAGGVNDGLAELLGVRDTRPLAPSTYSGDNPEVGIGRIGRLEKSMSLTEFAQVVADRLPATAHGVRIHGDLDRQIETVAVCGGSGDSYIDAAHEAGADVYLTADLKHHKTAEAGHRDDAPAFIDVAHFASEWAWLPALAEDLREKFGVKVHVSTLNTDPWTARLDSTDEGART